jgi:hypothetical protein
VIVAALAASLLSAAGAHAVLAAGADQPPLMATVGNTTTGQPMAPGFVGVSLEYKALHLYTGRDPRVVNPVLVQLLRQLAPGQSPVLRIGGDSTDATWWPLRGVIPPGGISYGLTPGWLRTTRALAQTLGARLILGINLAGGRPTLAAAEARAILQGVGRSYVDALEIGNEPDLYGVFAWYRDRRGGVWFSRGHRYGLGAFIRDFSRWRAALPAVPIAGPALAELTWLSGLPQFLASEPGLGMVTLHRYPLRGCVNDPTSPAYASIANLLSDSSSSGVAQAVAPYVAVARARGVPFRIDEMNSASCSGRRTVSDTFASALWVLDTLFNLASVGADGVNLHTLPGAGYELFTFTHASPGWQAFVHPEYYGMLMFAGAFPAGAQLLPVTAPSGPVKVWATRAPDSTTRVVLINKDVSSSYAVQLQMPGLVGNATLEWLQAPSASATSGVTLGGQTFGPQTGSGLLAGPGQLDQASALLGSYSLELPPASAVLLTQPSG